MTAPLPRPPAAVERLAEPGDPCGCAHAFELHHPAGPCVVELPPFVEEELPAWRCSCRRFTAAPAGPWHWHTGTSSWALVTS